MDTKAGSSQKIKIYIWLFVGMVLSGASFYGWVYNMADAWQIWTNLWSNEILPEQQSKTIALEKFLTDDWSTVTTGLIFLTFFYPTLYLWYRSKLFNEKKQNKYLAKICLWSMRPTCPYTPNYQMVFTMLGLLGTFFAFIVAFDHSRISQNTPKKNYSQSSESQKLANNQGKPSPTQPTTDERKVSNQENTLSPTKNTSSILLGSLATAIWSSFTAVLLAWIVCPFITRRFTNNFFPEDLQKECLKENRPPNIASTQNALKKLVENAENAGKALGNLKEKCDQWSNDGLLKCLNTSMTELTETIQDLPKKIKESNDTLAQQIGFIKTELEKITNQNDTMLQLQKEIGSAKEALTKVHEGIQEENKSAIKHRQKIYSNLSKIFESLK